MIIEYLREKCGQKDAISVEMLETKPLLDKEVSSQQIVVGCMDITECVQDKGGTMRLGNYTVEMCVNSRVHTIYNKWKCGEGNHFDERHRHRYEISPRCAQTLQTMQMSVSAYHNRRIEVIELINDHPFYLGCQFHPEYNSSPFHPHPLFMELLKNTLNKNDFVER